MGVVYRAVDPSTGEEVALKTIHLGRPDMGDSIRREIHALAHVRHPGVIRIVDQGVHRGDPWYAMELIEGRSLRQLLQERGPLGTAALSREPTTMVSGGGATLELSTPGRIVISPQHLGLVLRVGLCLTQTLAYLHGEGIVHRDIKPENIIVRSSGAPVLVDFGVVARRSLDVLPDRTTANTIGPIGTAMYMAPELIEGSDFDARADFYALGCVLFEMLTGGPPFSGAEAIEILWKQLEVEPPRLADVVDGIPVALDRLVGRLLAKDRRNRPAFGDEVARELVRLGASVPESWTPPVPRAYVYRPSFIGRVAQLRELDWHLWRLKARTGGMVILGGRTGVGKSALLDEVARRGQARRLRVLVSSVPAGSHPAATGTPPLAPLQPLLAAIATWCRRRGRATVERVVGRRAPVLAAYEPAFAALPGLADLAPAPEVPPATARVRLFTYLAETLAGYATGRPLLLILDDLHRADDLTLGFLRFLIQGRQINRMPILIVAAYEAEEAPRDLTEFLELPGLRTQSLDDLRQSDVNRLVAEMLGTKDIPERLSSYLWRYSEGVPVYVVEYLRAAVDEGLFYRSSEARWAVRRPAGPDEAAPSALPRRLDDLLLRRIRAVRGPARAFLDALAILGGRAEPDQVAELAELDNGAYLEALASLHRDGLVEDLDSGQVRCTHQLLATSAARAMGDERRRAFHRRAAELLASGDRAAKADPAVLAFHWERAGEVEQARVRYLASARRAVSLHAGTRAEASFLAYLRLHQGPTIESVAARIALARDVYHLMERPADARRQLDRALEEARTLADREGEAEALLGLATIAADLDDLEEARRHCSSAIRLLEDSGNIRLEASGLSDLGKIEWSLGHIEQAEKLYRRAIELHRRAADRRREGVTMARLGQCLLTAGRRSHAEGLFEEALAIHREVGNLRGSGTALHNLASIAYAEGHSEKARRLWERALAMHREVGDRRTEGITLGNLASVSWSRGRLDEASDLLRRALTILREVGDEASEGSVMGNLAQVYCDQGRPDRARTLFQEALDLQRRAGNRRREGELLREIAALERRAAGSLERAQELIVEAGQIAIEQGDPVEIGLCLVEEGHINLGLGLPAADFAAKARELLEQTKLGPMSELAKAVDRLDRALRNLRNNGTLYRGECIGDYPEGLRQWLDRRGELPETHG